MGFVNDEKAKYNNERFEILNISSTLNFETPVSYVPDLSTANKEGIIERYFSKKINDNSIIEINNAQTVALRTSIIYRTFSILWKITGDNETVTNYNKHSIKSSDHAEILQGYLTNLTEFWKGN